MSETTTSNNPPRCFPPTRWSLVLAATGSSSPKAQAALETVCCAYWHPLYAYARRCGQSPEDAQDSTQEFFRRLLEKRWLQAADREKGRLRTFLISAFKHFMAKEWRRASAQRRGGGQRLAPLDTAFGHSHDAADPAAQGTADEVFDREWALTLLDLTVRRLEAEYAQAGKAGAFAVLKEFLTAKPSGLAYSSAAARLGLSDGAARVAIHRLRRRFRELYRELIAETLSDGEDVDGELRYLAGALAKS